MSKIKIGFEVTSNWDRQDFRNIVYAMQDRPQEIDKRLVAGDLELFIISTDDSSMYVWNIGAKIGLDTAHTIVSPTTVSKLASIESNQLELFMDPDYSVVLSVETNSEYADGILVDSKQDYYNINFAWYSELVGKIKRLLDELEG